MKNLFYKELKLSMHPVCWIFTLAFALMAFIPSYPAFISTIYALASYTFLFLGASKGQTTNDLFYTCNLPIRKQEVVKGRLCTISFLHAISLIPLAVFLFISDKFILPGTGTTAVGLRMAQGFGLFGFLIIGLSITDLIFIPWFYKTGKSILGPTLVGMIVYCIFGVGTTIVLPGLFPKFKEMLTVGGANANYLVMFGIFGGALLFYALTRFIIYKASVKRLLRLDF